MKKTDLAYMAGLFDGEGCIQILKQVRNNRRRYWLRCSLEMTNEYLPKLLQMHFGGSVRRRKLPLPRQNQWEWVVVTRTAYLFLKSVYQYLKIKKGEADVAFEFQASMHEHRERLSEEELAIREVQKILLSNMKIKTQ